jgi:hypothetical protein
LPLSVQSVLLQNITLLYDSLDLNLVDRNKLRGFGWQPFQVTRFKKHSLTP